MLEVGLTDVPVNTTGVVVGMEVDEEQSMPVNNGISVDMIKKRKVGGRGSLRSPSQTWRPSSFLEIV